MPGGGGVRIRRKLWYMYNTGLQNVNIHSRDEYGHKGSHTYYTNNWHLS